MESREIFLVSDGANIVKQGSITACYKLGEAVLICWDSNNNRNELISTSPCPVLLIHQVVDMCGVVVVTDAFEYLHERN